MTRHVTEEVLQTYTLDLIGPPHRPGPPTYPPSLYTVLTPEMVRETEENLTDLLPPDYRVEIKEWDE